MLIKKFVYLFVTLLLGIIILEGCSTENNSFINRTYHSTTAKYNGYFNANELIKTSLTTYRENKKEDFYDILPIESVPDEKEVIGMLPSIDTAVVKCTKVIRNHCMPSMERPEGKKVEHNSWIDENWNLIGQAYYYRRDYELSTKNFEFIKELFKNDKSTYIARIWIIKNQIAQGKLNDAKSSILEMDEIIEKQEKEEAANKFNFIEKTKKLFAKKDKNAVKNPPRITRNLKADFNFTKASFYIAEEDYPKAIEVLEKAIKLTKKKQEKIRGHFILGQLYSRNKNLENAKNHFNWVVKSPSTPFEMQFNARINRAFLGRDEKVKKELTKLLKDEKNADYRDQLYYALADIAFQEKNKPEAINLLHKSTYYSTNNKRQQAISYERLGIISYQDKQYVKAQKYYDSCVNVMPENYPYGDEMRKKANKLKKLVESVTIVETQDSLLRIASMSEKDRENYIKKTIKKIKDDASRKQREEKAKMQAKLAKQIAEEQNNPSSNKWYWNNAKSKADGYSEFKKNWGVRENTDDWRRNDKIIFANADTSSSAKITQQSPEVSDTLTVEYLSKNLPFSDKARDSALSKLVAAEYDAGIIYKEQLNEAKLATSCFQDILNRKYASNYNLLASFQLYKMNEKDANKSAPHRNYILTNYPNSDYASYLRDPNYFIKQKEQEKKNEEHYVSVLEKYRQKNYAEVITACLQAGANSEETMKSKFLLLRALATAASTEDKKSISPILNELIKTYPETAEAKKAKEMADILEKGYSKYEPVVFKKEFPFEYEEGQPLWIILFLDKNSNSNAAKNKISTFNDETFEKMDISVSSKLYESDQSVIILKSFSQTEGDSYIKSFKGDTKSIKEYAGLPIYMISQDNLKLLFENKNLEIYKDFYQEYFK